MGHLFGETDLTRSLLRSSNGVFDKLSRERILELGGGRANADPHYQKLWRTLQRFAKETQVSAAEVQWSRLAMRELPTWSKLPPAQVSMSCTNGAEIPFYRLKIKFMVPWEKRRSRSFHSVRSLFIGVSISLRWSDFTLLFLETVGQVTCSKWILVS